MQITEPTFTGAKAKTFTWKCTCSVNQSIFAAIPRGTGVGWGPDLALSHQHSAGIAAVTPIRLHSGKGKANEDGFLPHTAAAERVTEGNTAGSCFIVALITPRAAEVLLLLEPRSADGCLSKQAAPTLQWCLWRTYHPIPTAGGHGEENRYCWNSFDSYK